VNYGIGCCGVSIYILYEKWSGVLVMDMSRNFMLLFFSSSNVKISFGVMLLKLEIVPVYLLCLVRIR
jgi:hypothetical protein